MNKSLLDVITNLKESIKNSEDFKKLTELNKLLDANEDVMKLAYQKDLANTKYNDAIRLFGEDSKEAQTAQKELYKAKLNLDSHELVKQYNEQYKVVKKMYDKINEELFNPFN